MVSKEKSVELGFAEKTEPWRLRSKFFPSKLGGKPAWLALKSLPNIKCSCGEPMTFVLQVYAPLDDNSAAFHRTLFVFACQPCVDKKKNNSIVVYRSQLALSNEFYPDVAAVEIESGSESPSAQDFNELCCVCGCVGSSKCALCKNRLYCSKNHQTIDWKKAHKFICLGNQSQPSDKECGTNTETQPDQSSSNTEDSTSKANNVSGVPSDLSTLKIEWGAADGVKKKTEPKDVKKKKKEKPKKEYDHKGILPEFDIETETEEIDDREVEKKEDTQEDLIKYLKGVDKSKIATMKEMAACSDSDLKEIEDMSKSLDDKAFKRFKKIIDPYPEQILRYCKGGEPVWVSADGLPEKIPVCEKCKGPREFEFQVMPHALNLMKNELLDWGTLAVYCCKASCDIEGYTKEFIFRQDFT